MAQNDKRPKPSPSMGSANKSGVGSTPNSTSNAKTAPLNKGVDLSKTISKVEYKPEDFPTHPSNWKFMLIAFGLIVLGFCLMGGSHEDLYSFRTITLSVIVAMAGFIFMIYAIMREPSNALAESEQSQVDASSN
jgi:hypothetical protein